MRNCPDLGMCLRFNSVPIIVFIFSPRHHAAEHDGAPLGEKNFLACHGCDFRRFGRAKSFSFGRLTLPPHIICLLAYLAFAGASVLWAFRPELSFIRFAAASDDCYIHCSACHAGGSNSGYDARPVSMLCIRCDPECLFRTRRLPDDRHMVDGGDIGYPGYFLGKNYLGECAAVAFLLSASRNALSRPSASIGYHRCRHRHFTSLLKRFQNSVWPCTFCSIRGWTYVDCRKDNRAFPRRSFYCQYHFATSYCPAYLASIWIAYHISYTAIRPSRVVQLYGISRNMRSTRRPLLGWGYQSFWLVGPDAPSIVDAPGWVKTMPNAHNGYYDTMLEMGYVGLCFARNLHHRNPPRHWARGRPRPRRAWLVLSLALFIIL